MDEHNPYAAPIADAELVDAPTMQQAASGVGIFRKGKTLIMHKMAQLPNVCLKTGQPAERRVKKKLQWHHPAIAVIVLLSPLIYIIVALVMMKRATIEVPVTHEWMRGRRNRLMITLGIFVFGSTLIGLGIWGAATENIPEDILPILFLAGGILALGGLIAAVVVARIVWPAKIDETHIHLNGVHRSVVGQFPEWPYPS